MSPSNKSRNQGMPTWQILGSLLAILAIVAIPTWLYLADGNSNDTGAQTATVAKKSQTTAAVPKFVHEQDVPFRTYCPKGEEFCVDLPYVANPKVTEDPHYPCSLRGDYCADNIGTKKHPQMEYQAYFQWTMRNGVVTICGRRYEKPCYHKHGLKYDEQYSVVAYRGKLNSFKSYDGCAVPKYKGWHRFTRFRGYRAFEEFCPGDFRLLNVARNGKMYMLIADTSRNGNRFSRRLFSSFHFTT